jgi:3-hydroxyacyl-CoA dehydrogenase
VVGTGAMGRGIAQIAAQTGSTVLLHDTQAQAMAPVPTTPTVLKICVMFFSDALAKRRGSRCW